MTTSTITRTTLVCLGLLLLSLPALALDAVYTLHNVRMAGNGNPITGTFTWTYNEGEFENGVGQFSELDIPYTDHDQTDLIITIDVGSSIEFTLDGNFHDDGVDVMLAFIQPLTPDSPAVLDLEQSSYDIGGNGLHQGLFMSGSIQPAAPSPATGPELPASSLALGAHPNPFNPRTAVAFTLAADARVTVTIHDLAGRRLRTLAEDDFRPAGRHTIDWNGQDDRGRALASGTYFVLARAGEAMDITKVTLHK